MTSIVHNPDQIMAWTSADIAAFIGKHLTIRVAASPDYWTSPHTYNGPWDHLHGGVVASAAFDKHSGTAIVRYTDGNPAFWIAGQPVYITVTDPETNHG